MNFDSSNRTARALAEAADLLRAPQRILPLLTKIASDKWRITFESRHLYSYAATTTPTSDALRLVMQWILNAQKPDGGIAAFYSLLTGYSDSYPEVTGYLIPTLYDFAADFAAPQGDPSSRKAAENATSWLLTLQMPCGAFPGGLHNPETSIEAQPSIFNTGQILQGLVRAHLEHANVEPAQVEAQAVQSEPVQAPVEAEPVETTPAKKIQPLLNCAVAAGDWLASAQLSDGSWSGPAAYQGSAHTYYTMVAWALARLAAASGDPRHSAAAARNLDWALAYVQPSGWIEAINLHGHPTYLHFIAYAIQGILECGILLRRDDAIQSAAQSAWLLLRKFETHKRLSGAYEPDFKHGENFSCLTGNAQMSCIWLRLFEVTADLRYLNAALKMNEMLKQSLPAAGPRGVVGGVAGSHPIWATYQPLRFISWGNKFLADALLLECRLTRKLETQFEAHFPTKPEASGCA